jgi:hypothetical protein
VLIAAPGCGPRVDPPSPLLTIRAEGDLDGDGERSLIERSAVASPDQSQLIPFGVLRVDRRVE